jgi:para-aminobenzoate synthetase component I
LERKIKNFFIPEPDLFMEKLTHWLFLHEYFSLFSGNGATYPFNPFETFAAAGAIQEFRNFQEDPFRELMVFYQQQNDWLIGRFNYDLKNYIEKLTSRHIDRIKSPEISFFVPETLIFIKKNLIEIHSVKNPEEIWKEIGQTAPSGVKSQIGTIYCDTTEEEYLAKVGRIKEQIFEGDFYELNYCLEYYCENARLHPPAIHQQLNQVSPMPMSVFQGIAGQYIMSASPERFLKKSGNLLIAQPIKGTIRRDDDPVMDEQLKENLRNSEKEIAENMMIVDLMRNDLAKSAIPGSVKVPEIFGIYSFSHLHQMISTITCQLRPDIHPIEAIRNAFPMGSMTGAPKIRAMQEIENYESSRRGSFSGAAGYFSPDGNYDFNVLIRSIFYNRHTGAMKFNTGSAITCDARAEDEYAECRLKALAILEVLTAAE